MNDLKRSPHESVPGVSKPRGLSHYQIVAVIGGSIALLGLMVAIGMWAMYSFVSSSEFGRGADKMFGDQHIKTAVALIELHKTRYGEYPSTLEELKFIGNWDLIALQRVSYCATENRDAYFLEVQLGWIGKPSVDLDDEFWRGTGYRRNVGPCNDRSQLTPP